MEYAGASVKNGKDIWIPQGASESYKRRNPHLYGSVARLEAHGAQRPPLRPLVKGLQEPACGQESFRVRVRFIVLRKRLLDRMDNENYALKSAKDAVAEWLGLNDNDERIEWQCEQHKTKGREGVLVQIEATI